MKWLKFGQHSKIRQQTLQLVSLLNRWCQVREDLMFALEKTLGSGLEDPVHQAVGDLLARLRGGLPVDQALDLFQKNFDHEQFQDLIVAIRFNFRYRGDLPALLSQLEVQMHKVEEEYTNRRLSNARDRKLTLAILLVVPLFMALRLGGSQLLWHQFLDSPIGLALLFAGLAAYLSGVGLMVLVQRQISG